MGASRSVVGSLGLVMILSLASVGTSGAVGATPAPAATTEANSAICDRPPQLPNRFPDVADDSIFCNEIAWMAEEGITTGRADGTFGPAESIRRGQMAAFLHRYAGEAAPAPGAPTFSDVPPGHVFSTAISWLAEQGVTTGRADGTFGPGEQVTRGQMAAFLYRFTGQPPLPADAPTFPDVPADSVFADAISWLAAAEITTGQLDGRFNPAGTLNRGQMSAFLARYDQYLVAQGEIDDANGIEEPSPDEPAPSDDPRVPDGWELATGHVEVTLVWSGGESLSLTVTSPDGQVLSPATPGFTGAGTLERRGTPSCEEWQEIHGNHAVWTQAPPGSYVAQVSLDQRRDYHGHFRLEVRIDGEVVDSVSGPTDFDTTPDQQARIEFEVMPPEPEPEVEPQPEPAPQPEPELTPDDVIIHPDADWTSQATRYRGQDGQRVAYSCPEAGTARTIWGTDIYTDDSSVCTAAVHAGAITLSSGGTVEIEIRPGQDDYLASTRHGVRSHSWRAWPGSFVVTAHDAEPVGPDPEEPVGPDPDTPPPVTVDGPHFVTTWDTTLTTGTTIRMMFGSVGTDVVVDWGDGNMSEDVTGSVAHTYEEEGVYTVTTTGSFERFGWLPAADAPASNAALLSVSSWEDIEVDDLSGAFAGATNLTRVARPPGAPGNMRAMFSGAVRCNQPIGDWDTSNVTDMSAMFHGASAFNQPIGDWDTSNVTNMSGMFRAETRRLDTYLSYDFNQPIGDWDTSSVTDMSGMFRGANDFDQPIGDWDTSSVTDMSGMFVFATSFDQPLGEWDTGQVTTMSSMFRGARTFNQPIGTWDISNVISLAGMFGGPSGFNQPIGSWDTSNVRSMAGMFDSRFMNDRRGTRFPSPFNQPIGNWDTRNVTDMEAMFFQAQSFNQDLSGWCVPLIRVAPRRFDTGTYAWGLPGPVWGTCPADGDG